MQQKHLKTNKTCKKEDYLFTQNSFRITSLFLAMKHFYLYNKIRQLHPLTRLHWSKNAFFELACKHIQTAFYSLLECGSKHVPGNAVNSCSVNKWVSTGRYLRIYILWFWVTIMTCIGLRNQDGADIWRVHIDTDETI